MYIEREFRGQRVVRKIWHYNLVHLLREKFNNKDINIYTNIVYIAQRK